MVCAASFSAADGHGGSGQAEVECDPPLNLTVAIAFRPGTPPFWPSWLESFLMLRSTSAAVTCVGCPGSVFQLATVTVKPGRVTTVVPAPLVRSSCRTDC